MRLKKSTLILTALGLACSSSLAFAQTFVPGHFTKKGKFVPAHVTKGRKQDPLKIKKPRLKVAKPKTARHAAKAKAGMTIRSSSDSRLMAGDRVTSVKDSHGVSYPMRNRDDWERFTKDHSGNETVTIHVTRDGKGHSFKVKNFRDSISF